MAKEMSIEKLKGSENYHTWIFAMKNVLTYKGLINCVDPVTETDVDKIANCKALIVLSVDTSIYVHIQNCITASDIWKALKRLYDDKGLSRKIGLLRNLISARLDNCDSMQAYVEHIKCYSNKLSGVGFDMTDEWLGAILLAGLTDHYRPFIMGIEAGDGEIKSDTIISKLLDSGPYVPKGSAFFDKKKIRQ